MTTLLLKGGRIVDPSQNQDGMADLLLVDGRVEALGKTYGNFRSCWTLYPEPCPAGNILPEIEYINSRSGFGYTFGFNIFRHLHRLGRLRNEHR